MVLLIESDQTFIEDIISYMRDHYCSQVNIMNLPPTGTDRTCLSGLEISIKEMLVMCDGKPVKFSLREFAMLLFLVQSPKQVFSKKQLYEAVWDDIPVSIEAKVECMIYSIRKKLRTYTDREYIRTVWGVGYKFDPEI